jgi:hypothetical protein
MHWNLDTYDLALHLCGMNPENDADFENEEKVDEILYEKYGIEDTEGLDKLIKDLGKLIDVGKSPLTEKRYKGFANERNWLYKIELTA